MTVEDRIKHRIEQLKIGRQELATQLVAYDAAIGELESLLAPEVEVSGSDVQDETAAQEG